MDPDRKPSNSVNENSPSDLHGSCESEKFQHNCHSSYNKEEIRLYTFSAWPAHYPVNQFRLSKSGFYYTGHEDEVVCFSCGGKISHWQYGDIVHKKHMDLFPFCNFLKGKSDNVPLISYKKSVVKKITSVTDSPVLARRDNLSVSNKLYSLIGTVNNSVHERHHVNPSQGLPVNQYAGSNHSESLKAIPNFQNMASEEERLRTFNCGWPLLSLPVSDLAKAGFFFLGYGDKVQCAFCHGIVKNWEANDIPIVEHKRHFPNCEFIVNSSSYLLKEGNLYESLCKNICQTFKSFDEVEQHSTLAQLGVNVYNQPAHPQQATLTSRLKTFMSWPDSSQVRKEDLAAAGFFYIGISDYTKCFHCDGGLHSWEAGDDPWFEHALWFRCCTFLRINKGVEFINSCIKNSSSLRDIESHCYTATSLPCASSGDAMSSLVYRLKRNEKSSLNGTLVKTEIGAVNFWEEPLAASLASVSRMENIPVSGVCEREDASKSVTNEKFDFSEGLETSQASKLLQEYDDSNDHRLCKVCMDNDVGVVFLPCGHFLACTLCAPALNNCPSCRKSIQATVRAFLM